MARLVTSGFEWKITGAGGGVQIDGGASGAGTWTNETTNQRSGANAASITLTSGSLSQRGFSFPGAIALGSTGFARVYFRMSAAPGTNSRVICGFNGSGAYVLLLNTDGTVSLAFADGSGVLTTIGSASSALSANVYYRLELSQLVAVGGTSWSGTAMLDGASFASESAVTRTTAANTASNFLIGATDTNTHTGTVTYIFDDLAVNDDSTANQNTWPGSGKVVLLIPTSDNAVGANWVAGAGGLTSLFAGVDNKPPVGVALASGTNTSQIKNVTKDTTGNYDAKMTTYTAAGIVASDTVNVAHPHWNLGSSAGSTISHAMLLVSNPAANAGTETTFTPTVIAGTYPTNWPWQIPAAQVVYAPSVTLGTNPVMRVGKRTSSTSAAMSDAMGIYVDYTPAPVIPPTPLVHQSIPFYPRASRPS